MSLALVEQTAFLVAVGVAVGVLPVVFLRVMLRVFDLLLHALASISPEAFAPMLRRLRRDLGLLTGRIDPRRDDED